MRAAGTVLIVGDSLSSGYGLGPGQGWVTLLEQRLRHSGSTLQLINASVSGETTRGGVTRIDALLQTHHPSVVILELGANDGLRGLPVAEIEHNLATLITRCRAAQARPLLVGMRIPDNYGPGYTRGFAAIFPRLARRHAVPLLPFLLAGLERDRQLFQPDGLHPVAAAQPQILDTVWRSLEPMITPWSLKQY